MTTRLIINGLGEKVISDSMPVPSLTTETWVRPTDWLTLPTVTSSDSKFVGLYAIFPYTDNYITMNATAAYTVDWGDGVVENYATGVTSYHKYDYNNVSLDPTVCSRGYKMAIVTVTPQAGQQLTSITLRNKYTGMGDISTSQWLDMTVSGPDFNTTGFTVYGSGGSSGLWFHRMLERIVMLNLGNVSTMSYNFYGCIRLKKVVMPTDTTKITNTSAMFLNCYSLEEVPLFDTSNVTNAGSMFQSCRLLKVMPPFNLDKTQTLGSFAQSCSNLQYANISGSTANCTNFSSMFRDCLRLVEAPMMNVSNSTTTSWMVSGCRILKTIPPWNTSKSQDFSTMFYLCTALESVPSLNTSSGTNFSSMFSTCYKLVSVPKLDTARATNMGAMFASCSSLKRLPKFDYANTTTLADFCINTNALLSIEGPINANNCTTFYRAFASCYEMVTFPQIYTSKVVGLEQIFNGCYQLERVPDTLDTANCTNFSNMFRDCYNLKSAPQMNTSN